MRKILPLLIIFIVTSTLADDGLMFCLGREELRFYQNKDIGPEYNLNQHFIDELNSLGPIRLSKGYYNKICKNKKLTTSVALLKYSLLDGPAILEKEKVDEKKSFGEKFRESQLKKFFEKMPSILFQYTSSLQSKLKKANCLEDNIPALKRIKTEFRYLGANIHPSWAKEKRKDFLQVFEGLQKLDKIRESCKRPQPKNK